ncbi:hypothetical protein C8J46_109122 [Sphingomonas sp. PP-F2F-A104-K0414]|uniref:PIN domain-containing protein n=1 Tax=Sphingomonas sp. PP-F2F-A104-K0414 TaxID=2135661 RepID=UPI001049BF2F|nr:PIN domain-containing protein [Sphingomonas sp. PP-F2F-A104-K0414]TCP96426.1 hypothetical protein C8J46_109122 [Sphingomonas sp. PP-F2F-A104-K0414]
MPEFETAELERMVAAGGIGGITIDTSVFDRFSCNLDSPSLTAMEQFVGSPVRFLLTDVVLGEIRSHMIRDAEKANASLEAALRELVRFRRPDAKAVSCVPNALAVDGSTVDEVETRIAAYLDDMEVERLTAGALVDIDGLLVSYFATLPPFETGKGKKAEFPDAIALLELEQWGERNGRHVLAVAADSGWSDFAREAKWVIVTDALPTALGLFHQAETHNVERATSLFAEKGRMAHVELASTLNRYVDSINPEVQAQSYLFHDVDLEGFALKDWEPPAAADVAVIASDETSLTLSFVVASTVEAEASFSFSIRDSWDGDQIAIGGATVIRDIPLDVAVVARVSRHGGADEAIVEIATEGARYVTFDFGAVEPDHETD